MNVIPWRQADQACRNECVCDFKYLSSLLLPFLLLTLQVMASSCSHRDQDIWHIAIGTVSMRYTFQRVCFLWQLVYSVYLPCKSTNLLCRQKETAAANRKDSKLNPILYCKTEWCLCCRDMTRPAVIKHSGMIIDPIKFNKSAADNARQTKTKDRRMKVSVSAGVPRPSRK